MITPNVFRKIRTGNLRENSANRLPEEDSHAVMEIGKNLGMGTLGLVGHALSGVGKGFGRALVSPTYTRIKGEYLDGRLKSGDCEPYHFLPTFNTFLGSAVAGTLALEAGVLITGILSGQYNSTLSPTMKAAHLLPIATNTLSLLYECGRYLRYPNKALSDSR